MASVRVHTPDGRWFDTLDYEDENELLVEDGVLWVCKENPETGDSLVASVYAAGWWVRAEVRD